MTSDWYLKSCLPALLSGFLMLASGVAIADEAQDVVQAELLRVVGTMDVAAQPQMSKGQLTGCILTFDALQQDWVYLHGKFIKISGSFGLMASGEKTATVLKAALSARRAPFLFGSPISSSRPKRSGEPGSREIPCNT